MALAVGAAGPDPGPRRSVEVGDWTGRDPQAGTHKITALDPGSVVPSCRNPPTLRASESRGQESNELFFHTIGQLRTFPQRLQLQAKSSPVVGWHHCGQP